MISVFGSFNGSIEKGLKPEDEEYMNRAFDALYSSLPLRQRSLVEEHLFKSSGSGIAWIDSMQSQLVIDEKNNISVFFKGNLKNNPLDVEDGEFILQEYLEWKEIYDDADLEDKEDSSQELYRTNQPGPLDILSCLTGQFAIILYDAQQGRIIAARDLQGLEPLVWGTSINERERLLLSSDRSLIECLCDVADFPPGYVYVSDTRSIHGHMSQICIKNAPSAHKTAIDRGTSIQQQQGDDATLTSTMWCESANNLSGMVPDDDRL